MKKLILILFFIPSLLYAQNTKRDSIWLPLKPFIGVWKGEGGGEPGKGKYERTYQFILERGLLRFVINRFTHLLLKTPKVRNMKILDISVMIKAGKLLYSANFM